MTTPSASALLFNPTVRTWVADPSFASMEIGGATITKTELQVAAEELAKDLLESKPTWLDRKITAGTERLAEATQRAETMLERDTWWARTVNKVRSSKFGQLVARVMLQDAERVAKSYDIKVNRTDGTSATHALEVEDAAWSKTMQRVSFSSQGISSVPGIPFWGMVVPALTAAVSAVGGGFAALLGRADVAGALGRMSIKHLVLGVVGATVGIIPVVGSLIPALVATQEAKDLKALQDSAPTVEELNNLARAKASAPARSPA